MKKIIKVIKKKDAKITKFFERQELSKLERIYTELEEEHQEIKENLKEVNYLLDLIEKHKIDTLENSDTPKKVKKRNNWLEKIKSTIENLHLSKTKSLSSDDIEFLQKEKSKLLFEKSQLEKEHHHIHQLIAKSDIYVMDVRNMVCEKITKGHNIAAISQKLIEYFGNIIEGEADYNLGRKKIMRFLETTFLINKIQAKTVIDILEKSKILHYTVDLEKTINIPEYDDFIKFTNLNYRSLIGTWHINA